MTFVTIPAADLPRRSGHRRTVYSDAEVFEVIAKLEAGLAVSNGVFYPARKAARSAQVTLRERLRRHDRAFTATLRGTVVPVERSGRQVFQWWLARNADHGGMD